jgi:hypothetical protein
MMRALFGRDLGIFQFTPINKKEHHLLRGGVKSLYFRRLLKEEGIFSYQAPLDFPSFLRVNTNIGDSFSPAIRAYIQYCKDQSYTARYIGSLVADFHRNLLKGGIYIYPATQKDPGGKLRLMYECNALAFLVEEAGGKASDGHRRILDIQPESLHQRTPFYVGSRNMVERAIAGI